MRYPCFIVLKAIIDLDTWERVQELRKNKRRPTRTGKTNMFSGIVRTRRTIPASYWCKAYDLKQQLGGFLVERHEADFINDHQLGLIQAIEQPVQRLAVPRHTGRYPYIR